MRSAKRWSKAPGTDPIRDWDGLVTAPNHMLITPEQMTWNAMRNMAIMEQMDRIVAEDEEAKATPIGGMQFRYQGHG